MGRSTDPEGSAVGVGRSGVEEAEDVPSEDN